MLFVSERSMSNIYIDATDSQTEGQFTWTTLDSRMIYHNFDTNEPNNAGGEDCVWMRQSGKWNDIGCHRPKSFVCEIKSEYLVSFSITAE